ncbi:type II secretion system GspH family protein [Cytobacillus spongiae]|jgi:competence protein ComGD|uniref:competence type IV pilus minor pilin ComGD n=1 Tax=Cytobacillus spongiae TaxID=2901381 RepID=UPI001F18B04C|nr:competence type IV pilus minor pilin ComGD [Cytobacillus spongiae]UII54834.1 type II secretion system GspH family protein [Cytobacillus spongiae]
MKPNENGFTLIEALSVLSMFLLMTSISIFSIRSLAFTMEKELFFSQFEGDMLYAQEYALSHQQQILVIFSPTEHYYIIRERNEGPYLAKRYYSKNIEVHQGSLGLSFDFTARGNINKFGSLLITIGTEEYKVTFFIGRGRFYVQEGW